MNDQANHDRLVCKLQHFADCMKQRVIEKESLSIILTKSDLKSEIRSEILIYQEILDDYYDTFDEIIQR